MLDPFCGSGTSGLEAIRLGRRFIGIDTNPVALLISEAKLAFPSPKALRSALTQILYSSQSIFAEHAAPPHPNESELLKWYHPQTMAALNGILHAILQIESKLVRKCFLALFSAILKNCSSQGRHWGWVCDNVTPKINEISFKDATAIFVAASNDFLRESDQAFREAQIHLEGVTRQQLRKQSTFLHGDCVQKLKALDDRSVDLIVTSPPYYGVADYVKSQRLSFLWFDVDKLESLHLGFRDFERLRATEAGARSVRHRSNSHEAYMAFMESFFHECLRVLRPDASLTLVVGESSSRASTIDDMVSLASTAGLALNARLGRDIKATRRRLMAKVKGEEILVFCA